MDYEVKKIAIYGSGQIGKNLALKFSGMGVTTLLFCRDIEKVTKEMKIFTRMAKKMNKALDFSNNEVIITDNLDDLLNVEIFSCGPHPMLEAVSKLAKDFNLPCQVSLEEYMACAVGGCAGCVVEVQTESGPAMKRVCVDGPVFEAQTVF